MRACDLPKFPAGAGHKKTDAVALLLLVLVLLAATACAPDAGQNVSRIKGGNAIASPTTPGTAAPQFPSLPCTAGDAVVPVTDAAGLQQALQAAQPGQTIRLADGRYSGHFVATAPATAAKPIVLCGSRSAVIDGGDLNDGYTLHLMGASYWQLQGFTVTGGQKGVVLDAAQANLIKGLLVTSVGDEAIHLRTGSSDNVVTGNTIRDPGRIKPKYGEGVYVGTARSNWCQYSKCGPDRSDRNQITGNDIAGTTAESVDIKEGTSDGLVADNRFDGSNMTTARAWVNVKGNHWMIRNNRGTSSPGDGYAVHEILPGWGLNNVFSGNQASRMTGFVVNVAGSRAIRAATAVGCTNKADGPPKPISNVPCVGA